MKTPLIVAIDGGAGTGTSSAAEGVATALSVPHLNTGSMYRAIAWACRRQGLDWADASACDEIAANAKLEYTGGLVTRIDGFDVTGELYINGMGRGASAVSGHRGVRHAMVNLQREFAHEFGAVLEGRDIGTNVFPESPFKFYFICDPKERLRRLRLGGRHDETLETLHARDVADEAHEHGTFLRHADAVEIDTTELSPAEVIAEIVHVIHSTGAI